MTCATGLPRRVRLLAAATAVLSLALGAPAKASTLQYTFTGEAFGTTFDAGAFGTGPFSSFSNAPFTATFVVDTGLGHFNSSNQSYESDFLSNPLSAALTINNSTVSFDFAGGTSVGVGTQAFIHGLPGDPTHTPYFTINVSRQEMIGSDLHAVTYSLTGPGNVTDNTSSSFDIVDFDFTTQTYLSNVQGSFRVASVSAAATPLPASLPLFTSGLAAFGLLRWRGRRARRATAG